MNFVRLGFFLIGAAAVFAQGPAESVDRQAMQETMAGITTAFAQGDLETIAKYHHPAVEKALSYTKLLKGRHAVMADLRGTLGAYRLTFVEHEVESLQFFGDTCIEQTRFAFRGDPKGSASPFTARGRAMVAYVRYAGSPSGWASIREVIQPGNE